MGFQVIVKKAREINDLYDELNKEQGYSQWKLQEYVQGFMEDLGTLTRLTMMKSGLRATTYENLDEKLQHEVCEAPKNGSKSSGSSRNCRIFMSLDFNWPKGNVAV